jgi:8-oxo-dGTP pyrophosphatase MutT (NUDIX family)
VVRRKAGRVLVVDAAGRLLLLHGHDPARPDQPYWLTVGGGAEPGESLAQAAARELAEEVGIAATASELGQPVWRQSAEFSFDGARFAQEEEFFLLRVSSARVSLGPLDAETAAVIDGYQWWTAAELDATAQAYYPRCLPDLLRRLAG